MVSLVAFGWGRNLLRAGEATVEVASEISMEGTAARADVLSGGLTSGGGISLEGLNGLIGHADDAEMTTITEEGKTTHLPGIVGKPSEAPLRDFKPASPVTAFRTVRNTDWESVLGKQQVQTITNAVKQAAHMHSPEIAQSLRELNEIPGIANTVKLSGINFANSITHYGQLWTGSQIGALTIDSVDKLDSVLSYFDISVPGYNWVKEHART